MEIKFQVRGRVFSICIGHRTKWFGQLPLIMVVEQFYENRNVYYANCLWRSYITN